MMEDPKLDEDIINYYSDQRLSSHRLEMLLEETRTVKQQQAMLHGDSQVAVAESGSLATRCLRFLRKLGELLVGPRNAPYRMTLASFCMLAGLVWFTGTNLLGTDSNNSGSLSNLMLREAALNHQTKLQVEYSDSDVVALGKSMQRLDFELKMPADLAKSHTLLGGRYCTLAGNLAVHLRLQPLALTSVESRSGLDLAGEAGLERSAIDDRSVFVTLATEELAALGDLSHVFPDQIAVNSWQQGELFYLLAESASR